MENGEAETVPCQRTMDSIETGCCKITAKKNRKGEMRLVGGEREGKRSQQQKDPVSSGRFLSSSMLSEGLVKE